MTNEQKAKEIARLKRITKNEKYEHPFQLEIYEQCLEMAKWKDEQHKKEIADLKRKLNAERGLRKQVEDSIRGLPQPIKELIKAMNMVI